MRPHLQNFIGVVVMFLCSALACGAAPAFRLNPVTLPKNAVSADTRVHPVNLVGDSAKELAIVGPTSMALYRLDGTTDGGEYVLFQTILFPDTARGPAGKIYYGFARVARQDDRRSILLLTPEGVAMYPPDPAGNGMLQEPVLLIKKSLIRGQSSGRKVQYFDFALDLDGDGLDDLLIPEDNGFSILHQSEPLRFRAVALPKNPYERDNSFNLRQDAPDELVRASSYSGAVRRKRGVENLLFLDVNGDGLQDLVYTSTGAGPDATEVESYDVYLQRKGMSFDQRPYQSMQLPYDAAADISLRDLNHDGRLDIIAVQSNLDLATPRTSTKIYYGTRQGVQFLQKESDRFITKDPIGLVRLGDLNGDGAPDLTTTYFSYQFSSAEDIVQIALANRLKFKLQFYVSRGAAGFVHQPDAEKELTLYTKADSFRVMQPFFLPDDMNGDRAADLVVRSQEDKLEIYPSNGPLSFPANPTQTIAVPDDAEIDFEELNGDGRTDMIVSSPATSMVSVFLSSVK